MMVVVFLIILFFVLNMNKVSTELLKVYRFQFKKREPILVAASSYIDALATLARSPYKVDDDESLECISIFNNLEILV